MKIGKSEFAFLSSVGGAIVSVIIHFLIKLRVPPLFLQESTVLATELVMDLFKR